MVKKKSGKPDFKVPIPFTAEKVKDEDLKDKAVAVKLQTTVAGAPLMNPITEFQPIFNQGTTEQYFKWIANLQNVMSDHTVREKFQIALKTLKGSDRDLWMAQANLHGPVLVDVLVSEAAKERLFVASIDLLSVHVLKEDFAGVYQRRYLLQYLFLGTVGVRTFCDRLDVLSSYMLFFPPDDGVRFERLSEREKQSILHDALPPSYICLLYTSDAADE